MESVKLDTRDGRLTVICPHCNTVIDRVNIPNDAIIFYPDGTWQSDCAWPWSASCPSCSQQIAPSFGAAQDFFRDNFSEAEKRLTAMRTIVTAAPTVQLLTEVKKIVE